MSYRTIGMAMWHTFTVHCYSVTVAHLTIHLKCTHAKFRKLKSGNNFPEDRNFTALIGKSPFLITVTPSIYMSVLQK